MTATANKRVLSASRSATRDGVLEANSLFLTIAFARGGSEFMLRVVMERRWSIRTDCLHLPAEESTKQFWWLANDRSSLDREVI
jgi:hypothetical protein